MHAKRHLHFTVPGRSIKAEKHLILSPNPYETVTMDSFDRPLVHDESREATSSYRGYVYQVYQSLLAWILLNTHEILYLEAAEDFDVHEGANVTVTQVKDTYKSGAITLRTPDVVEAINNYWRHRQNNTEKTILMRFVTTSTTTQERGTSFGDIGKGIDYWMMVTRDENLPALQLRDFLITLDLDKDFKDFLSNCAESDFRTVVKGIKWDVGIKSKEGLERDIEEWLIIFGDRRGIDSLTSKRVLNSLLKKVSDTLCSKGNRSLTYVQFCETFDEATLEVMPKGEALALRSIYSQLNQLATSSHLTLAPRVLDTPLPLVRGAAPRQPIVSNLTKILKQHGILLLKGSTGLGKTSLASLISQNIKGEWSWAGFRDRDPAHIADLLQRMAFEVRTPKTTFQIVLDDLDLSRVVKFETELISLVFSVRDTGGLVMITGPSSCPPNLLNKLWIEEECDQEVPYLNEDDISAIANSHGLENPQQLLEWSRVIWLTTQGHPQLVHARIRNLQNRNWPQVQKYDWIKGDDLDAERMASRRRLAEEIPDRARDLAYRLSLLTERFKRNTAIALAQLPPPISLAGEAFDLLVGPWVEYMGNDSYRISPLLLNQGKEVMSANETNAVHEAIALDIMSKRRLVPSDVGAILSHALAAHSEQALVYLSRGIMFSNPAALQAIGDEVFWFPTLALGKSQRLFDQNPVVEIFLRLAQFKVAAASKQTDNANAIIDRTEELLSEDDNEKFRSTSYVMAYSTFLNTIEVPIDPGKVVKMLSFLADASKKNKHLQDIERNFIEKSRSLSPLEGLSPVQSLFTFEIARVSGLDHLNDLLVALKNLDAEKRSNLILPLETIEATDAELLVNTAWWRDVSRGSLDVNKALTVFRFAIEVGTSWQAMKLVRASFVAMAIVVEEYGHDPETALSIMNEAESVFGKDDARILNERAKILMSMSRQAEALPLFEKAIASGSLPLVEQKFSARNAGVAAARTGNWAFAESLFIKGALVEVSTKDMARMSIGLLADAAFARWKQGKAVESLTLYAEVLTKLETIPINEILKNRYIHAVIGHSLLWLSHSANAAQYNIAEPSPGMCSNQEPNEGFKDREIRDISCTWGMLGSLDTKLGTNLNLFQIAKERCAGKLPLLMEIDQRWSSYVALFKNVNITSAIRILVEMYESLKCKEPMESEQIDGWSSTTIPPLPIGFWTSPEWRQNLLQRLISVAITATCHEPTNSLPLDVWQADLKHFAINGAEISRFFEIITGQYQSNNDDLTEVVILHLYRLREETLSPSDLFICHFKLLNYLTQGEWGNFSGESLAEFISRQWVGVADTQRFAINSPAYYAPLLKEKCDDKALEGYSKVASILETAASATGVRLAASAIQYLSEMKSKSRLGSDTEYTQ